MHGLIHNGKQNQPIDSYREMKIEMLDDFKIKISDMEKCHFYTLKTEVQIDNFFISMIRKYIKTHA